MTVKTLLIILCSFFILVGCDENRLSINVSTIECDVEIGRFDKLIFETQEDSLVDILRKLANVDSLFFDTYAFDVIHVGGVETTGFDERINAFRTDTVFTKVADTVLTTFENISALELEIENGFKHFKHYFQNKEVPHVYTCISGFNQSIIITNDFIGIALDNYLGSDCIFYEFLGIYRYKRTNMKPERIIPDLFSAIALSMFQYNDSIDNLLSNIIYHGKVNYFVEAMNPELADSIIIGYSPQQIEWCTANEGNMWAYLAQGKLLYDFDRLTIRKFIGEAPSTAAFSQNSPGRTGAWLGWQIVRSYMKKHPEITLEQLMNTNEAQVILSNSGYYPN